MKEKLKSLYFRNHPKYIRSFLKSGNSKPHLLLNGFKRRDISQVARLTYVFYMLVTRPGLMAIPGQLCKNVYISVIFAVHSK